jgi:RHS repeat-associated protein
MFDVMGREVWGAEIDAYGQLRNVRGDRATCPFRWPGQYEDEETGLNYNRCRYYQTEAGQYLSQDPIGLRGGLDLLGYVVDPSTLSDPLGLGPGIDDNGFFAARHEYGRGSGSGRTTIPLQGSRDRDFVQANKEAGFSKTPEGYTWHHANYDPETGMGEMQLVKRGPHRATPGRRHIRAVSLPSRNRQARNTDLKQLRSSRKKVACLAGHATRQT